MVFPVILDGKCNVLQDLRGEKLDYIKINKYSSVPLYEQIRQCIIEAIQKGILKPGQKLHLQGLRSFQARRAPGLQRTGKQRKN